MKKSFGLVVVTLPLKTVPKGRAVAVSGLSPASVAHETGAAATAANGNERTREIATLSIFFTGASVLVPLLRAGPRGSNVLAFCRLFASLTT